ncbi:hypothetical protein JT358_14200 [Micrococcales bacterium 31B]|nr:hypothetical protein [Micrococcales bacterium 31B]
MTITRRAFGGALALGAGLATGLATGLAARPAHAASTALAATPPLPPTIDSPVLYTLPPGGSVTVKQFGRVEPDCLVGFAYGKNSRAGDLPSPQENPGHWNLTDWVATKVGTDITRIHAVRIGLSTETKLLIMVAPPPPVGGVNVFMSEAVPLRYVLDNAGAPNQKFRNITNQEYVRLGSPTPVIIPAQYYRFPWSTDVFEDSYWADHYYSGADFRPVSSAALSRVQNLEIREDDWHFKFQLRRWETSPELFADSLYKRYNLTAAGFTPPSYLPVTTFANQGIVRTAGSTTIYFVYDLKNRKGRPMDENLYTAWARPTPAVVTWTPTA